ncbi:hypothetical protein N7457_004921 [Penicillium paradoxum]|uniref:uncharacterized protein n=1 Tax=Penicillium paradoxum TaxID=176176 RepID=UPI0025473255|nr:uncharacterized protein N7457_004921 [Penicillium paradoxum]KAJ5783147.1 hypothetical protein N7457_004921 [Penicillium paradoxum]
MDQYQSNRRLFGFCVLQGLIPSVVLATTPKQSALRYLTIPCMIWIMCQMMYPVSTPGFIPSNFLGHAVTFIFTAADYLLINPQDRPDFVDSNGKTKSFLSRLAQSAQMIACTRAVNTARQAKNVPPMPAYYTKRDPKVIPRGRFLIRETAIAVWQFLALDIISTMASSKGLDQKENVPVSPGLKWDLRQLVAERIFPSLIIWFVVTRIGLSFYYRVTSIIFVGLGDSPWNCPPSCGRMGDAYTLRGFWGKFWHQMLRLPLTSLSNFLARDVLRLPRPSVLERYTNVFIVFFFSGLMHAIFDILRNVSIQESGAISFFLSFVVGYMIEDGIQALWKRTQGSQNTNGTPPWWQKAIGLIWVGAWLGVTSTWLFGTMTQKPKHKIVLVPFTLLGSGLIDFRTLGSIVLVSGVVLKLIFEGEI